MEFFGLSITLLTFMLGYLAWRNGKWMREATNRQTEMINKQTEMINKQTEMIKEVLNRQTEMINKQTQMIEKQTEVIEKQTEMIKEIKNVIVTEERLTRELMERIDKTTKEILGKILEKVVS